MTPTDPPINPGDVGVSSLVPIRMEISPWYEAFALTALTRLRQSEPSLGTDSKIAVRLFHTIGQRKFLNHFYNAKDLVIDDVLIATTLSIISRN